MIRSDWLVLFIAFEGAPAGLDPVRLQKGLFLFAEEAETVSPDERYAFEPYSYGPMSRDLYADLDQLLAQGLVEQVPVEGQTWSRYKATNRGVAYGHRLMQAALVRHEADTKHFYRIKQVVAQASFADLLEAVYDRYPAYAAKSIFKRR